jgi:ribosomal protein L12E/L44/L45/RPP1/RPP2
MKKLIAVLMVASFAGVALPVAAQTSGTPAPAASTPAASDKPAKSDKKHHNKKHSKENKSKTEPKS